MKNFFVGDVDEFYCNAVEGNDRRWAVWVVEEVPLGNTPEDSLKRKKGVVARAETTLLGRFDTEYEAVQFVEEQKLN